MESIATPIGIDLGTTNSVLAIYRHNKTEVIEIEGKKLTPSYVFYDPNDKEEIYIGDSNQALRNPGNGIYDVKRMIGRSFDDECFQKSRKNYIFNTECSPTNGIQIVIEQNDEKVLKSPQNVSAEILKKFKQRACEYLRENVTEAVITVPAYFNFSQRNATKQAAILAGLNVLMLLNEPTAAALHYLTETVEQDTIAIVFDLGGGTFDISLVKLTNRRIETLAVDGDSFLGGRNFDEAVYDYIVEEHKLTPDVTQTRRLMSKIEEMKKNLSFKKSYETFLDYFDKDNSLNIKLKRSKFEKIMQHYFQKCIDILDRCLKHSGYTKTDIKKVIMVGGSSRIPKIRQMVSEYFDGMELMCDLNPDEIVACGAAIQAASMRGFSSVQHKISDVTPFSLGISVYGYKMHKIFKSNTPIPASSPQTYVTTNNDQSSVDLQVFEGERSCTKFNNFLGEFTVKNLSKKPAGQVKVFVTFSIDESGLLKVTAKEENAENDVYLEIGVELFDLKNRYRVTLEDKTEEDKLFEEFVAKKLKLRVPFIKYVYNKKDDSNIEKCIELINAIDLLEFEERDTLDDLITRFKNEITDETLVKIVSLL